MLSEANNIRTYAANQRRDSQGQLEEQEDVRMGVPEDHDLEHQVREANDLESLQRRHGHRAVPQKEDPDREEQEALAHLRWEGGVDLIRAEAQEQTDDDAEREAEGAQQGVGADAALPEVDEFAGELQHRWRDVRQRQERQDGQQERQEQRRTAVLAPKEQGKESRQRGEGRRGGDGDHEPAVEADQDEVRALRIPQANAEDHTAQEQPRDGAEPGHAAPDRAASRSEAEDDAQQHGWGGKMIHDGYKIL